MLGPARFSQTIQVVDRSNKVVGTSKQLVNVFKEARAAYRERKAEIAAMKDTQARELRVRDPPRAYTIDDSRSAASSRSRRSPRPGGHRGSDHVSRRYGDDPLRDHTGSAGHDYFSPRERSHTVPTSPASPTSPPLTPPPMASYGTPPRYSLRDGKLHLAPRLPPRRHTTDVTGADIDMDLAYGELPPDLARKGCRAVEEEEQEQEQELKGLVGRCKSLLDEAQCLQYSATAAIAHLQKNPDAMAAVALTLAEISTLVKKTSPSMLLSLRSAAPAVFALLASPQFLIAVGVGVGVTIVALGGYKVVKRIQERKAEESMDAMVPVEDVSRIESWRRGIADAEAESTGTSVEGEFITPMAFQLSQLNLAQTSGHEAKEGRRERKTEKTLVSSRSGKSSQSKSKSKSKPKSSEGKNRDGKGAGEPTKDKKPSPLRMMFLS